MPARSAGLLVYRVGGDGDLEFLLVHPGGPFWARKDRGAWSIPKGEHDPEEDPLIAAEREFREEVGQDPPAGPRLFLGEVTQAGESGSRPGPSWVTSIPPEAPATRSNWSGRAVRASFGRIPKSTGSSGRR